MAGLQRSSETFRRSGSSGLVWEDINLAGQMNANTSKEQNADSKAALTQSQSVGGNVMMRRSRSSGGGGGGASGVPAVKAFRTDQVAPAMDPPSPKLSCCGFCGDLRKTESGQKGKPRRR